MHTYTVLSRLNNGEIEARSVTANFPHLAEAIRRQFCALPGHHVAEVIDVTFGPAIPFVVCVRVVSTDDLAEDDHGSGCDGPLNCLCEPYARLVLEAADERQALIHAAAIQPDALEYLWAEPAKPVHVHIDTSSQDCDGRHGHYDTAELPELVERGSERSPRERLGAYVGDRVRSLLMFGLEFSVTQHGSNVIVVNRLSDEGGSSTAYTLCTDRTCDEFGKSSQYDQYAESMGY